MLITFDRISWLVQRQVKILYHPSSFYSSGDREGLSDKDRRETKKIIQGKSKETSS
jgi:hypothetical protein